MCALPQANQHVVILIELLCARSLAHNMPGIILVRQNIVCAAWAEVGGLAGIQRGSYPAHTKAQNALCALGIAQSSMLDDERGGKVFDCTMRKSQ
jgi:hypothetical protein